MTSWRYALGEFRRRPGRSLLSLLSVVIAVGAIVAVTSAAAAAREAFQQVFRSLSGRADLEVVAEGTDFRQALAEPLRAVPHVRAVVPVFRRNTIIYSHGKKAKVLAAGIVASEAESVAGLEFVSGRLPTDKEIALEASLAASLKAAVGDKLKLLTGRGLQSFTVSGIFAMEDAARLLQGGMLMAPLDRLQRLFRATDQVDSMHVYLDDPAEAQQVIAAAAAVLPEELRIRVPASRTGMAEDVLLLNEVSLKVASWLSILTATFIVLSIFLMNVGERRRQLSILRAVGATRGQVVGMVCYEALLMGIAGTLAGIPAGIYAGAFLMHAMGSMLGVRLPAHPDLNWAFLVGALVGPLVCLVASWYPAAKASRVSPLEGMRPVTPALSRRSHRELTVLGLVGMIGSAAAGYAAAQGYLPIWASVLSLIVSLIAAVLLMPICLAPAVRLLAAPIRYALGVEGEMSERMVLRHASRSVLTIAVLFMAISTCLGISNAVLSVQDDIQTWYERAINADFLLRAMMPDISGHAAPSMSESLGDEIAALGGVQRIDPVRVLGVNAGGREAVLMARDFSLYERVPVDVLGEDDELLDQLHAGQAVVGSVLAERLALRPGDMLDVTVGTQKHSFRIAALATEYAFGGSIVTVDRNVAAHVFGLQGVDSYMIKAEPGCSEELEPKLQALADEKGLLLQSFREIVRIIDGTVTQITGGLWVLLIGGLIVGTLGVVNTLAMNVLEQTRELGMLRAIGMRRGQIIKTVLGQAAIIGWLGILTGGMSGVGLSHTINACLGTLFGRYIRFAWRPEFAVLLVSCALAAVLIAALWPARRAANLNPLEAMRQD